MGVLVRLENIKAFSLILSLPHGFSFFLPLFAFFFFLLLHFIFSLCVWYACVLLIDRFSVIINDYCPPDAGLESKSETVTIGGRYTKYLSGPLSRLRESTKTLTRRQSLINIERYYIGKYAISSRFLSALLYFVYLLRLFAFFSFSSFLSNFISFYLISTFLLFLLQFLLFLLNFAFWHKAILLRVSYLFLWLFLSLVCPKRDRQTEFFLMLCTLRT